MEALRILDTEGFEHLSMRVLAARVGINPMTIYHHFKDRNGLIKAVGDMVYSDVSAPGNCDTRIRIAGLLSAYRAKVIKHPALTLAIFGQSAVFPDHAKKITDDLGNLLGELDISPELSMLWVHILVDFTHGAALALAVNGENNQHQSPIDGAKDSYEKGIAELLKAINP
ncbi:TetR/AcrR family transcriptional regulator [Brucella sp. TWI432]